MTSREVDLDGPVHFADFGGEGPPMVLVHGLGGSHVNWLAVGPALARNHQVLAPDLAGFGRTPLEHRSTTVQANAGLLHRFIEHVVGAPATLVGNSMGGLLSMMVAATMPRLVRALVLVDATHAPARGMRVDHEVTAIFAMYGIPWLGEYVTRGHMRRTTPEKLVRRTLRLCCAEPDKLDPGLVAAHVALETERRAMPWSHDAFVVASRSILRMIVTPGRLRRLAERVEAPTLVIHGDRDRLVPVATARAAAARHHWDLEILEGVGHVPQLEAPDRFVRVVEAWLARGVSRVA